MDDSMRVEYPAMLANLQPLQAVQTLNDRVKRISKLNIEIADWLQERRKVEEQYVQGLRKLAQFRVPNAQSELGTFQVQWDKIVQSSETIALSHHQFADKIEKDVEMPLRTFHMKKETQNIQTIQGNLQSMAKELDDAQKKSDVLSKKAGKTSAAKMDQAASRLESATSQWESQAPFIFETLQALDETRMNQLRDVMTQYGTYEGEQAQRKQVEAEAVLNSLLDFHTSSEIQYFASKTTTGRPRLQSRAPTTRQSSSFGGVNSALAPTPSINAPPSPVPAAASSAVEDDRSEHSYHKEEKAPENRLRSRLGTMLGRRRQSIHGGFGQLSPSKGSPFGRNTKSSHGPSPRASSSNLGESSNKLSSLAERPDSSGEPIQSSEVKEKSSHEGTNGINADTSGGPSAEKPESSQVNGTNGSGIADFAPPPGPPPSQREPQKDADGFTVPAASNDPISAAEKDAAGAAGDEVEPAFKLNIQKEPVADEDPEERLAALSNFSNSLSALGVPTRRTGTIRGRRDVRNTIYVPAPVSENSTSGDALSQGMTSLPTSLSKPPALAALASEASIAGTSDTQSIRSSNSLSSVAQFKHPDLHAPGLNSSFMETISATFEEGEIKSVKINGEIAFSYNPAETSNLQTHQLIRINNFPSLEVIGPNRIFVANQSPDLPDQFSLDTSHLRQSQANVGFSYRLHVEPSVIPVDYVPLLLKPAWKPQGEKLGLLLQYKLNPAFKFGDSATLHNVVFFATYEGNALTAQTKPSGTHLKEKHLVYWRLGDLLLNNSRDWQKIVCRIGGDSGVEPKPGDIEVRWECIVTGDIANSISISKLEEGKGKEVELSDDDPFADTGASDGGAEGKWVSVPAVRKLVSGKYEVPA